MWFVLLIRDSANRSRGVYPVRSSASHLLSSALVSGSLLFVVCFHVFLVDANSAHFITATAVLLETLCSDVEVRFVCFLLTKRALTPSFFSF